MNINPLHHLDKRSGYIYLKNNTCIEILRIVGFDIFSLGDELQDKIKSYQNFLKTYTQDFKIISLDYPVSTKEQLKYYQYKLDNCDNLVYQKFLSEKINELKELQSINTTEYFVILYSKDETEMNENKKSFLRLFNLCILENIDIKNKENILFKLNNMNTKIS